VRLDCDLGVRRIRRLGPRRCHSCSILPRAHLPPEVIQSDALASGSDCLEGETLRGQHRSQFGHTELDLAPALALADRRFVPFADPERWYRDDTSYSTIYMHATLTLEACPAEIAHTIQPGSATAIGSTPSIPQASCWIHLMHRRRLLGSI